MLGAMDRALGLQKLLSIIHYLGAIPLHAARSLFIAQELGVSPMTVSMAFLDGGLDLLEIGQSAKRVASPVDNAVSVKDSMASSLKRARR